MSTSTSDEKKYNDICLKASLDEKTFSSFKRDKDYNKILEHVDENLGKRYLKDSIEIFSEIKDYFEGFKENDLLGNPRMYDYGEYGSFSPTTLRYINVLCQLRKYFGSLDGYKIIEIGGGYGGQCKIISDVYKYEIYYIVDLPNTLSLQKKYLDSINVSNFECVDAKDLPKVDKYDLCISNYAFSECNKAIQNYYIENILDKSDRGFMICNVTKDSHNRGYLLERIKKDCVILPESPNTRSTNYLIVWGVKS